jgi:hypothetical protein
MKFYKNSDLNQKLAMFWIAGPKLAFHQSTYLLLFVKAA